MSMLADATARALDSTLEPLQHRLSAAHEQWASDRDVDFLRRALPRARTFLRYFDPEVRNTERIPETGPVLVVGNHSGYPYMPDVMATTLALVGRRGIEAPLHGLAYDLLFAIPGVSSFLRRGGALPAGGRAAEHALADGAAVLLYPGGDWEACRPWTDRNRVDFHGRAGFVRLALRTGVPVLPVVSHGSHHSVIVLSRGDRIARAMHLDRLKVHVMPIMAGGPFGAFPVLAPPPLPAKVTVEFLEPLDWTDLGAEAADDPTIVQRGYDDVTGRLQSALDRLAKERPHPILSRFGR